MTPSWPWNKTQPPDPAPDGDEGPQGTAAGETGTGRPTIPRPAAPPEPGESTPLRAEASDGGPAGAGIDSPSSANGSDSDSDVGPTVHRVEQHVTASDHARVYQGGRDVNVHHHHHEAAPAPVQWPVLVGAIPPQASAFQSRAELREAIDSARRRSGTVVLSQVLAGQGGVGKSQLAASYARRAIDEGTDLVVWADATQPTGLLAAYAHAALQVRAPGAGGRAEEVEQDADRFLSWLATTDRSWLVVLDNATAETPDSLWPGTTRGGRGRVIATTRQRGAEASDAGRALVDIGVYSAPESAAYLRERLEAARCAHLLDDATGDLTEALGHLPLALAYAAAYMIRRRRSASRYLRLFRDRTQPLEEVLPAPTGVDGYQRSVATALLLSLDAARQEDRLAVPALVLTALLDPAGHPRDLWSTAPVLDYLTSSRPAAADGRPVAEAERDGDGVPRVGLDEALDALVVLHNYSLVTLTEEWNRQVTLHALTARAALDTAPAGQRPHHAAADALLALWPDDHLDRDLVSVLRTNTDTLAGHAGEQLWNQTDGAHRLLFRLGQSLGAARLDNEGVRYWEQHTATAERILGPAHESTITALSHLATSYGQVGRMDEAVRIAERVLAGIEADYGSDFPGALIARGNLAVAYSKAGRLHDAIRIEERLLADRERVLGPDRPENFVTRSNLATSYWHVGRTDDAIRIEERLLADRERVLGPDHPSTLRTRSNLAASYRQAGRTDEAITIEERQLADHERVLGPDHPSTLTARSNLSTSYQQAGRTDEAITIQERLLADRERVLGPDHPSTLTTRGNLAVSYARAGRTDEAIAIDQRQLADCERVLGPDHPSTLTARGNLATSYWQAGRTDEALALMETVAEGRMRILGVSHPDTVSAQAGLAMVLTVRGKGRLPEDTAGAWQDAAAAVQVVGPHLAIDPAVYGPILAGAYRLAADALDADGQPQAAAEYRRRALTVTDAAPTAGP